MTVDLTVVIVTYNEARNLPACLATLDGWAPHILVVDSGSTDGTTAIAEQAGAQVFHHSFETFPAQWNWALKTLPIQTRWTLALDADHRVSPALRDSIVRALAAAPEETHGYYVERQLIFRGRRLRWGGCTRPMLKLFRTGKAWCDERDAPDMRFYVAGPVRFLRAPLWEDNRNEYDRTLWIDKQRRYAKRIAQAEWCWRTGRIGWAIPPTLLGTPDQRILWQKSWWMRLPRYVRPWAYFLYRYVVLGGFLDGRLGLMFHSVQGFWLRWQVDVELGRLQRASRR